MSLPLVHRSPTAKEIERLRLILSTYQDGTGQLATGEGKTLPGWRDFERAVALVFDGQAQESKAIFDVLLTDPIRQGVCYGISCKMRKTLHDTERTGRVTIELSNSAGKFWSGLKANGLDENTYAKKPTIAGKTLLDIVCGWHDEVSIEHGGMVDLSRSYYLVLQWDQRHGIYRLYQFALRLPLADSLYWEAVGRRLVGKDDKGTLFEWYGSSGGQLKYYPFAAQSLWISDIFRLEPLPDNFIGYGLRAKAIQYFPELWQASNQA